MDNRTKTALLASIEKWEKNASGPMSESRFGPTDCPLCHVFHGLYRNDGAEYCDGCPVSEKTGHFGCVGTPYVDAENAYEFDDEPAFRAAALAEVAFLKSLLPEDDNGNRD